MTQPRIGFTLHIEDALSSTDYVHLVQRLEDLGYDSVWSGESWGREVFTTLTQLACNTSRIHLGTGIANVYSRTPALMAQSAATLDAISGGRVILGLGSSGEKVVRDWHGMPFDKPLRRTREYIEIINLAIGGERVNHDGDLFHLRDFRLRFSPVRRHIPIHVAAISPKNIQLAGELADGWLPIYLSPRRIKEFRQHLETGAKLGGRKIDDIDIRPYTIACVSEDRQVGAILARAQLAFYIGGMGKFYHDLVASYGFIEETARIKDLWSKHDRAGAAAAITDTMLGDLAILGTARECRQRVIDLKAMGMGDPLIYIPFSAPLNVIQDTVEALAPSRF